MFDNGEAMFDDGEAMFDDREAMFEDEEAMFDDREAMFEDREAMFDDREAMLKSLWWGGGWVPVHRLVTATVRFGCDNRSGSNSREKEVTLEGVVKHKEELMKLLEIEERNFLARKEGIERNLVEIEKHEIVLRYF